MPRSTETIVLEEERDRLDERLDELAVETAGADDASDPAQRGLAVERQLTAVEDAIDEHGEDAEFTIRELTPGERAKFVDRLQAAQTQQSTQGYDDGGGIRNIFWVAACLVDAPFIDENDDYDARIKAVRDKPTPQLVDWLADRATEENTLGNGRSKSFAERVREAKSEASGQS